VGDSITRGATTLPFVLLSLLVTLLLALSVPADCGYASRPFVFSARGINIEIQQVGRDENNDLVVLLRGYRDGRQVIDESSPFIFRNSRGIPVETLIREALRVSTPAPFFATLTVFPDPGKPGTTSVDGDIGTNASSPYSTAHTTADCATGTGSECSGTTIGTTENSGTNHNGSLFPCNTKTFSVIRWLLNFDTSSLGPSATISAAVLSVKPLLVSLNTDSDFVRVVTNSGASANNYSTSDFGSFSTTAQAGDINVSALSAGTYADFTLNGTGVGNINKTGVTRFGLRCGMDIAATEPTPALSDCIANSSEGTIVFYHSADATGTADDPKLVITFSAPGGRKRIIRID